MKQSQNHLEKFQELLSEVKKIKSNGLAKPSIQKLEIKTEVLISNLFGKDSEYLKHFRKEADRFKALHQSTRPMPRQKPDKIKCCDKIFR
jgi:hypothetical protein